MKSRYLRFTLYLVISLFCLCLTPAFSRQLSVVATLPDYAEFTARIGGDRVNVFHLVQGNQDAHFIRPKPSFVNRVAHADVLVATGLDLELWLPTIIDKSGNTHIRSGEPGFVACSNGMKLLDVPKVLSRIEGGLHIYGNPHVTCSPLLMKKAAENIAVGLIKNDPAGKDYYMKRLADLKLEFDRHMFGEKLVQMLGGDTLSRLLEQKKLFPFLRSHKHQGKDLTHYLGGWLAMAAPLRGMPIVTYHENWIYFVEIFGLDLVGTIEPKPGIPPSIRHRAALLKTMKEQHVRAVLAANYFNGSLARSVARQAGAQAVIVPLYVGGEKGVDSYFKLVDRWITSLVEVMK